MEFKMLKIYIMIILRGRFDMKNIVFLIYL